MKQNYDVIVVGAGPGGSITAKLCAETGLKTLLIERERLPRYKPCGGCLSFKAVRLLQFNLDPIIENTIYDAKFTYCLKDPFFKSQEPIALMVMRDRFDQFLVEKALKEGAELIEGDKVIGVEVKDGRVEVELTRGEKLSSEYLVGADGPDSTVAKSLSLAPPKGKRGGFAIESEFSMESAARYPKDELHLIHLDFGGVPNGYGWVFPKNGGLSIGIGGMLKDGEKMNPRPYFKTFIDGLNYVDEAGAARILGHPLPAFYDANQKVSKDRVLLVGDAARLMDPLMGEGIYYALRSGMMAAESIIQSKEKGILPSGIYQEAVRSHLFENLAWALRFSQLVFKFTRLAYYTLKRYPELGDLYLQVLHGSKSYQGFVTDVKGRMKDTLKGRLSKKIRQSMSIT